MSLKRQQRLQHKGIWIDAEEPEFPPRKTSPFTSLGFLKKQESCPQICTWGTLMYYRIQQVFTAFTKTVISILGASDSLLYLQIFVSQNMNGWILGLSGKYQPFILFIYFLLFSHSVVSNSMRPHGLQHTRLPCPSPSPRACSNSCPLSQWWEDVHLILCCPFLLLPSVIPSIRVFSNESTLHVKWPKYWSFSISPSNEYFL